MKRSSTILFRRAAFMLLLVACGSRTGLFVDDTPGPLDEDGGGIADGSAGDAKKDASRDATDEKLPLIDAQPPPDAPNKTDCPDSDSTLVYVITEQYELFSFFPPDGSFKKIGNIACPTPTPGSTPFSMAVDRKGVAFIVFNDGNLFRVSTATAACIATGFVVGQQNFQQFGMGYATIDLGPAEQLYVAGSSAGTNPGDPGLATIDTKTFILSKVGNFQLSITNAELTGTGTGQLYAFYTKGTAGGSFIGEIDKKTAAVVAETPLPTVDQNTGWAFAFWGGDFYTFTGAGPQANSSIVTRVRPSDGTVTQVSTLPTLIVGAGVSTCAPEQ